MNLSIIMSSAEQKQSLTEITVRVSIQDNWKILTCWYTCMAGAIHCRNYLIIVIVVIQTTWRFQTSCFVLRDIDNNHHGTVFALLVLLQIRRFLWNFSQFSSKTYPLKIMKFWRNGAYKWGVRPKKKINIPRSSTGKGIVWDAMSLVYRDLLKAIFRLKCDSGIILMRKIHGGNFLENGCGRHVTIKNAWSATIFFSNFQK